MALRAEVSVRVLWKYLAGDIPKKVPKLAKIAEACGCHPVELLAPTSRNIYELLLYEAEQLLIEDTDFADRALHVARTSREIRMWEKFFQTGDFGDEEREVSEAQKQIEDVPMMPEGADPLLDDDE